MVELRADHDSSYFCQQMSREWLCYNIRQYSKYKNSNKSIQIVRNYKCSIAPITVENYFTQTQG